MNHGLLKLCDEIDKVRKERDEAYERAAQVAKSERIACGPSLIAKEIRALKEKP